MYISLEQNESRSTARNLAWAITIRYYDKRFKTNNTKFVDDSTIFEVVLQNARSNLEQTLLNPLVALAQQHGRNKGIKDYILR